MAQPDEHVESGQERNEDIAFPVYLSKFLDERSAAIDGELFQPMPEEPSLETDEDAEKRAAINRRILEKLGILSEVEELHELAKKRNRTSE
jgi:hypothetical protein